jgi:hypothetical protein
MSAWDLLDGPTQARREPGGRLPEEGRALDAGQDQYRDPRPSERLLVDPERVWNSTPNSTAPSAFMRS